MSKLKITALLVVAIALIGFAPQAKADNILTRVLGDRTKANTEVETNASANANVSNSGRGSVKLRMEDNVSVKGDARDRFFANASTTVTANNMSRIKGQADKEIDRRIDSLNKLMTRINAMTRVSASEKSTLNASVQTEIGTLTSLKAKIDADTDISVLKTDFASITASYRVYLLVLPQAAILAASDRINTITDMMTTVAAKFQTRIDAASAAGHDVVSLQASLSDYNAKVADAKIQYQAAASLVINLTPDNGDQTKADANKQALVDARAKIKAGQADLKAARDDAKNIIKGLVAYGDTTVSASADIKVSR